MPTVVNDIIYETSMLLVYHNDSGEIFIEHKETKHKLCIRDYCDSIITTTCNCVLTPTSINNCMGVKTYPRSTDSNSLNAITCDRCGSILFPPYYKCTSCD